MDPYDSRKYSEAYDISEPGLTHQQKEMRYVTWLQQSEDQPNANQSLEWLYVNSNQLGSMPETLCELPRTFIASLRLISFCQVKLQKNQ